VPLRSLHEESAGDHSGGTAERVTTTSRPEGLQIDELAAPRDEPARDGSPPDDRALARILETATTVPDHGGLRPWRFAVVTGAGRARFGEALVSGLHFERGNDLPEAMVSKMRNKAFAAPCAVVLIASPDPESNVPIWEQVASASCTGYAMVLAATALGLGAVWKSAAVLDTQPVRTLFALTDHERLLGWVNMGTPDQTRKRRPAEPADLRGLVRVIDAGEHPFDPPTSP
jgi:nitroreductase